MKTKAVLKRWQTLLQTRETITPRHRSLPTALELTADGNWQITFTSTTDVMPFKDIEAAILYLDKVVTTLEDGKNRRYLK